MESNLEDINVASESLAWKTSLYNIAGSPEVTTFKPKELIHHRDTESAEFVLLLQSSLISVFSVVKNHGVTEHLPWGLVIKLDLIKYEYLKYSLTPHSRYRN